MIPHAGYSSDRPEANGVKCRSPARLRRAAEQRCVLLRAPLRDWSGWAKSPRLIRPNSAPPGSVHGAAPLSEPPEQLMIGLIAAHTPTPVAGDSSSPPDAMSRAALGGSGAGDGCIQL